MTEDFTYVRSLLLLVCSRWIQILRRHEIRQVDLLLFGRPRLNLMMSGLEGFLQDALVISTWEEMVASREIGQER
jgi:hypothetical protein